MNKVIVYFISFFFILGGIDYILGNPLKLGQKFEEGIKTMGTLGLGMIGIYSLSPIIADFLEVFIVPMCNIFHFDPSIFPSMFLATDMGGFKVATDIALKEELGLFSGVVVAASLGASVSFSIPIAISMVSKEDRTYLAKGIMIGIISIPIGSLAGGLWQRLNINMLIWNLLPYLVLP